MLYVIIYKMISVFGKTKYLFCIWQNEKEEPVSDSGGLAAIHDLCVLPAIRAAF